MSDPGPDRIARALPLLAVLAAVALLASQVLAWVGVERAAQAANRGEADVLLDTFEVYVRQLGRRPEVEDLQPFLEAHADTGLHYVAVRHPGGRDVIEAGDGQLPDPGEDGFVEGEGRVRALRMPAGPGRPPHAFGPPHADARPPPPPRPPPQLVVELAPRLGPALRADGLRTLVGAAIASVLFALLALALRRAIRQREVAARRAEHDRRLAALGEMSAVLAHELRNPLASLKGHAQLLLETLPEGERPRAKAARIVSEAERIEELTTNLLEFVRSGQIDDAPLELRGLVRAAVDAVGAERFEVALPERDMQARGDRPRLLEALINLLTNAAQASEEKASVELVSAGGAAKIVVRDRGPGIDEDQLAQIFEPFHTTRIHGTGLGLPIARRIVEGHRGTIEVANRDGGGATFTITLPLGGAGAG
ncbi:MAG: hypothetical protein SangKO_036450 [Sandaracinaceae bacterium]